MPSFDTIELSRQFRRESTKAEKLLWEQLRRRNFAGYKFRRQHPVEGYILDFYCAEARLAIEVDGNIHKNREQVEYDCQRTIELAELGIEVIRFWNEDVEKDMERVKAKILQKIDRRSHL